MTPAQLGALIHQHNLANAPSDGKHARTPPPERKYDSPADLAALASMKMG